jgi:CheY-like chemotaxis protein
MSKKDKILIVEDEFIVAYDLKLMLTKGGYLVTGIASSVERALQYIEEKKPDWVLIDIILKGELTGVDLAQILHKRNIPFLLFRLIPIIQVWNLLKNTTLWFFGKTFSRQRFICHARYCTP